MVKTTKKLLNFLQLLNKYVQKETKKRNLFIRRWLSFGKKWKPQRGHKAMAPLHTPRAFFRSSWLWWCEVVDLCMYAAVLDVWGWADVCGCGWCWMWTARRVAVAWLRGCVYGCGWCWDGQRGVFVVAWLRIFFIFCLRRGGGYMYSWILGCIVQDVLSDILEEEWWFFGFVQVFWFVWLVADVL